MCFWACQKERHRKRACPEGLQILREKKKCDVACLSADIKNHPDGGLYHELGFKVMDREISFEDVQGEIRYVAGETFIPVCSKETYN